MNKLIAGLIALAAVVTLAAVILLPGGSDKSVIADNPTPPPVEQRQAQADPGQSDEMNQPIVLDDRDTEIVMGIEVRKDRNCTVKQHMVDIGNGLVTDAYSCDPPEREDPFAAFSDADLLVMSYSDAAAATELGKRLLYQSQEGPANDMMLRAVALNPDDINPLRYLITQTGSLRGESRDARKAVGNAYIITRTASHFDPTISTHWLESDLIQYRFMPEDIERLDRLVDENLERMRQVQIEVFGESRIGEEL